MRINIYLKISFICTCLLLSACASQQEKPRGHAFKLIKEAALAYKNKNWKRAEKKYALLISESPGTAEIWFKLGNIYARTSRPDKAIAAYKEAVIRQSSYEQAWRNLGIVSLRKVTHIYIEMLQHLDPETENYIRAKKTSKVLLKLIKRNQVKHKKKKVIKADL